MDEFIVWLQKFGPLIGGMLVPLGGLWLKLRAGRQDPTAVRSMKQHARLHDSLPKSARGPIKDLIQFEADTYATAQMRKGRRTPNAGAIGAFVIVALLTGGAVYLCIALALTWWGFFIVAGIVAMFGGGLLVIGGGQLFDYEDVAPKAPDPAIVPDTDARPEADVRELEPAGARG